MDSEIKRFYENSSILITGGTGLLGQLLIEKLLRLCSNVEGIYLIVREKKGKSAYERGLEIFRVPVFDRIREVSPDFMKKIHIIAGDCSDLSLGLDGNVKKIITGKVSVVFHCAATTNMNGNLQKAINTNVRSLHELIQLSHEMKNLKSMIFVSTTYSNCIQNVIEEKFYPTPLKPCTILKFCEQIDSRVLNSITPKLLDKWPNTYCYSKAIAENLIEVNCVNLPLAVFRPSMVLSTYAEPIPGWTSNLYGPMGFFLFASLGISRVIFGNAHTKVDVVPADFCINALICSAWNTHIKFSKCQTNVPIYNYSAGPNRTISLNQMAHYIKYSEYPSRRAIWARSYTFTECKIYYYLLSVLLQYLPGFLIDMYLFLHRRKTRLIKAYMQFSKFNNVIKLFICQEWNIKNDNVYKLWDELNETDKKLFPFDMSTIDYKYFFEQCALGVKLYVLKETLDNITEERNRYQRLVKLHNVGKLLLKILGITILFHFFSVLLI